MARKNASQNMVAALAEVREIEIDPAIIAAAEAEAAAEQEQALETVEVQEAEVEGVALAEAEAVDATETEAAGDETDMPSFDELLLAQGEEAVEVMVHAIAKQIDIRAAQEAADHPDNESIQKNLKNARAKLVTKRAARVLLACNVEPTFINRSVHEGSFFNVYGLGKLADIVKGLTDEGLTNAINVALIKSLFNCEKAKVAFTHEVAKAAASNKIPVDFTIRQHLVRHTVSASTASTQTSSTMHALQALGIVKATGSGRNPTYIVQESPVTKKLREVALKAA